MHTLSRRTGRPSLRLSRRLLQWLLVTCLVLLAMVPAAVAGPAVTPARAGGADLLVRMPPHLTHEAAGALLHARGLEPVDLLEQIDVWRVRPRPESGATVQSVSAALDDVALWVEEDGLAYAQDRIPDDPYYASRQWNLPLIGLEQAWEQSRGAGVVIAIIDSGMDLDHPDLQAKLWTNPCEIPGNGIDDDANGFVDDIIGWDFIDSDAIPEGITAHGTHVAGIAGALTNNGVGIAGVGWDTRLMPIRVLAESSGPWSAVAYGILYAADNGARVVNLSLGGPYNETVAAAIVYAQSRGCLVVAAAGNYGTEGILFPASLDGVLAVSASNSADQPWASNNYGPEMDIAAPGVSIYSTWSGGLYSTLTGTSMATPHVSGVAALIWHYRPDLTWDQVAGVITSTAVDIGLPGWDETSGWGRIDARAALLSLVPLQRPFRTYIPMVQQASNAGCLPPW